LNLCKTDTDRAARMNFVNCYVIALRATEIEPTFILFSDEAWFHFSGYLNSE